MLTVEQPQVRSPFIDAASRVADQPRLVVSVYPMARQKQFKLGGFLPILRIEAAEKGKWTTMPVGASFQVIPDISDLEDNAGSTAYRQAPVSAEQIAMDCVNEWRSSIAFNGFPGIDILPLGIDPEITNPAFKSFINGLTEQQRIMAEWLITDGADKFTNGHTSRITELHRRMAVWHLGDASKSLPWFPQYDVVGFKPCIACGEQIKGSALRCKECNVDLIDYATKYPALAASDPVLLARVRQLSQPVSAVSNMPPTQSGTPDAQMQPGANLTPPPPQRKLSAEFQKAVIGSMNEQEQRQYAELSNNGEKARFLVALGQAKGIEEK